MIGSGVYFAVDEQTIKNLRSLTMTERPGFITGELEPLYLEEYPERTFELEGAWEAIHRALTGGFYLDGDRPLDKVILGGEILSYEDFLICAKSPETVELVCDALEKLSDKDFINGYKRISADDYPDKCDDDCEYSLEYLRDSMSFWNFCRRNKAWALFTAEL